MRIEEFFKQYKDLENEVKHLERELNRETNNDNTLATIVKGKIDLRNETRLKIENLLDELPPRDACIIRMFYIAGYSAVKTASKNFICERQFYREKKRILQILQEKIDSMQEL